MKIIGSIIVFIVLCSQVNSQGWHPAGARSMALGNASVVLDDVWGYHNNPGALGKVNSLAIGVSYENRFLLKEMQTQSLAVAIPLKVGVLSVGGNMYGYRVFRSYKAGVGYSMKLADKLSAGVQLNYMGLTLGNGYGSKNTVSAELGVLADITDNWNVGFSVFNLSRSKLSEFADDRFSTLMRLGTSYAFSEKLLVTTEVEKDLEYDLRFRLGIEYEIIEAFYIRGGMQTTPMELSFGFGYHWDRFQIDLGSAYHQNLGWSPNVSFQYTGKTK